MLKLAPSWNPDAPIACKLFNTPLEDYEGKYEALSYVWGSVDTDSEIECNEKTLRINRNCFLALKHLRRKIFRRVLWIDNICIDQTSIEERGHQVELMDIIYTVCRRVIIWLGVEEPGTRRAFRRVRNQWLLNTIEDATLFTPRISNALSDAVGIPGQCVLTSLA